MTNGIPILLFKVGSLAYPRGRALNRPPRPPPTQTWEPQREPQTKDIQPELEAPLNKGQLKRRRNKDSKLTKKFKNLEKEINNLKSQMDTLKDKNESIQEH